MVMPFSDSTSSNAYMSCIKLLCDEYNLIIRRPDEILTTNPVYDDIKPGLVQFFSDAIINYCDKKK